MKSTIESRGSFEEKIRLLESKLSSAQLEIRNQASTNSKNIVQLRQKLDEIQQRLDEEDHDVEVEKEDSSSQEEQSGEEESELGDLNSLQENLKIEEDKKEEPKP